MAQRKRKSIHDNISLEGLDAVFDMQRLKVKELEIMEKPPLEKLSDIITDTIKKKLKIKSNKKAVKKILDDLPENLLESQCTVFEKTATTKLTDKKKTKLREIIQLVVVHEKPAGEEKIVYLEDRGEPVIDVISESPKKSLDGSARRALEDQLLTAQCKIEIANSRVKELKTEINTLKEESESKDEEIVWLKSQQDIVSKELADIKSSWWWRFGKWLKS